MVTSMGKSSIYGLPGSLRQEAEACEQLKHVPFCKRLEKPVIYTLLNLLLFSKPKFPVRVDGTEMFTE